MASSDKTALVTGAGSGIGRAVACVLRHAGIGSRPSTSMTMPHGRPLR